MRAAWTAFVIASLFFLFEFVARVEPSLAAHAIARAYRLNEAGFGALASLFFWIYAPMQIVVGLLLDRYGAKRFILLGCFCCAAGVVGFALATSFVPGAAARALTGFGASFAFVAALWIVNHWFAPERFAVLSGAVNAVGMLGTAIGTVVLGALVGTQGWQHVFIGTGAAGAAIFLAALLFLREPPSPAQPDHPIPTPGIAENLGIVLRNGRIWTIAILGLLFYMPVNVYGALWGHTALMAIDGLSDNSAGAAVSLLFWGMAAGSVLGGWVSDKTGSRKWPVLFGALLTGITFAIVIYPDIHSVVAISGLLFFAGLFGGFQMLTFTMAKEGLSNAVVGTAVAFVNMIGIAGALIFQPLIGYLVDITHGDFRLALSTIPLCAGVAVVIALFLPEYRHPDHAPGARNAAADRDAEQGTA